RQRERPATALAAAAQTAAGSVPAGGRGAALAPGARGAVGPGVAGGARLFTGMAGGVRGAGTGELRALLQLRPDGTPLRRPPPARAAGAVGRIRQLRVQPQHGCAGWRRRVSIPAVLAPGPGRGADHARAWIQRVEQLVRLRAAAGTGAGNAPGPGAAAMGAWRQRTAMDWRGDGAGGSGVCRAVRVFNPARSHPARTRAGAAIGAN